jgi:hypothetical protein
MSKSITTSLNKLNITPYSYPFINPFEPIKPVNITINQTVDNDSPVSVSYNTTYADPVIAPYENLNADPKVRKRVVKFFYYKVFDKWIYKELINLLSYVNSKNKLKLVSSLKNIKSNSSKKGNQSTAKKKSKFLEEKVFGKKGKKVMYNIIRKYVNTRKLQWINLITNHKTDLVEYIGRQLDKYLKSKISKKFTYEIDDEYDD